MKQTVQMREIQERMRPGVITRDGFLGNDRRNLIDILQEDDAEVKRRNLTHKQIAERMMQLREAGKRGLGEFISVPPHFEVRVDSVRGKLPCPFKHPGLIRKTNVMVRNLELKREITYTDMHIHMVGEHGFYEGRGSVYRLEVKDLIEVLEIIPEDEEHGYQ
jgi:hypothetical protein